MWPFGERFPYSDTHELNLDWIIKVIKEVETVYPGKFDNLESEIKSKMNNPVNAGSVGNVLVNAGNGVSEWQPFDEAITEQINAAVNAWLDLHPEATTTVQDGAITPAKLDTELYKLYRDSGSVQFFFPNNKVLTEATAPGASCLMVTPYKTVLFDTNGELHANEIFEYYDNLYASGVFSNIDVIVISHFHHDHINNLEQFLTKYPHDNCIIYMPLSPSGYYPATQYPQLMIGYNNLIRVVTAYNLTPVTIDHEQTIIIDRLVSINVFNSDVTSYQYYSNNQYEYNNYSMVSLVKIGNIYAMFPGDLELEGQKYILTYKTLPRVSLYSVHHHGVDQNTDTEYARMINPLYSVIPNDYLKANTDCLYGSFRKQCNGFIGETAYSDYSFICNGEALSITKGMNFYNNGSYLTEIEYIVDNSYTGSEHTGTFEKPFTEIAEALQAMSDNRAIQYTIKIIKTNIPYKPALIRDIRNMLNIRAYENANKPIIDSVLIENCAKVVLSYLCFEGAGRPNRPNATFNASVVVDNSNVLFAACEFNGTMNENTSLALCVNGSKLRIVSTSFTYYNTLSLPATNAVISEIEMNGITGNTITNGFSLNNTKISLFDNCDFSNMSSVLAGGDRIEPVFLHRTLLTTAFADKCSASVISVPLYLNAQHPATILTNKKIYDILSGDEIT